MDLSSIRTISIIGAGTMGTGIAQVASLAGFEVVIYDSSKEVLNRFENLITTNLEKGVEKGKISEEQKEQALGRIGIQSSIKNVVADYFIEAVIEVLEVKTEILNQLHKSNPDSLFATNTSSIPITQIAAGFRNPLKLIGMHFFNPAHIMKLVEVVSGAQTNPEVTEITHELVKKFGKVPVDVKDSPGFIVNRVARHYYVESLKIAEEGISDYQGIDRLLESCGFKMGPYRLMDLIGVDTNLSVTKTIYSQFNEDPKFRPSRLQQQLVDAGNFGVKSGKGFYEY